MARVEAILAGNKGKRKACLVIEESGRLGKTQMFVVLVKQSNKVLF